MTSGQTIRKITGLANTCSVAVTIITMKKLLLAIVIVVICLTAYMVFQNQHSDNSNSSRYLKGQHSFSLKKADSPWLIVNKDTPINPKDYAPVNLEIPTVPIRSNITDDEKKVSYLVSPALNNLVAAAREQGITLDLQSGYRSYGAQQKLYENYLAQDTQSNIDSYSAKPGYSEHQTGLAVDLGGASSPGCNVKPCFAVTPESKWLTDNVHNYGFIFRYPEGKQKITGYEYEPWHLRYVGIYLATKMKTKGIATLEEYFKL